MAQCSCLNHSSFHSTFHRASEEGKKGWTKVSVAVLYLSLSLTDGLWTEPINEILFNSYFINLVMSWTCTQIDRFMTMNRLMNFLLYHNRSVSNMFLF